MKVTVVSRPDYTVWAEERHAPDPATFLHAEVHRWTAQIARRFARDMLTAQELLGRPVFVVAQRGNGLQAKFLALFGFVPCGHAYDDGFVVPVYGRPYGGQPLPHWSPVLPKE